jgi:hypothetical protein
MDRPMVTAESTDATAQPADAPLTILRGNTVDVDVRRLGRLVVVLCLVALAAFVIVFTIAGVQKNSQINSLRHDGIRTNVTVSSCTSLMGGSGSNAVGDSCAGTFTLHGRRYTENIPGTALRLGSSLPVVVVPTDPALLSPVNILAGEHASWKVFILPAVLLVVLALLVGAIIIRRRHHATAEP